MKAKLVIISNKGCYNEYNRGEERTSVDHLTELDVPLQGTLIQWSIKLNFNYKRIMKEKIINIAKDFAEIPYGRTKKHGPENGTVFRKILVEALKENDVVKVDFEDLIFIPGSSFMDEAFGGLTREEEFTESYLKEHLQIINSSQIIKEEVEGEIADGVEEK